MAHFAELNFENFVIRVIVISNEFLLDENGIEQEARGIEFCKKLFGENTIWKQTSYNTLEGKHKNNGIPFRKNYANIGFLYDEQIDAFIPPKPEGDGWVINEETGFWEFPNSEPL